jgi:hypothetical protein
MTAPESICARRRRRLATATATGNGDSDGKVNDKDTLNRAAPMPRRRVTKKRTLSLACGPVSLRIRQLGESKVERGKGASINSIETHIGVPNDLACYPVVPEKMKMK